MQGISAVLPHPNPLQRRGRYYSVIGSIITGGGTLSPPKCNFMQGAVNGLVVYFANSLAHTPNYDDVVVKDVNGRKVIIETRSTDVDCHSVYLRDENGKETLIADLPFYEGDNETGWNRIRELEAVNKAFAMISIAQYFEKTTLGYINNDGLDRYAKKTLITRLSNINHTRISLNGQMRIQHKTEGLYLSSVTNMDYKDCLRLIYSNTPIRKFRNVKYE